MAGIGLVGIPIREKMATNLKTFIAADNAVPMENAWKNWALLAVGNATVSVDTFFTLSGLLVGYLGMRQITKSRGKLPILLMYLQRYLR